MIYVVTQQILPESEKYRIATIEEALAMLEPLTIVGLDTETAGFDPHTKELKSLQLGCFDYQVVIDCTTVSPNYFKQYLESDRLFIGWNIKFDLKFLFHKRIVPRRVYDGYLAEKLMWLGYPSGYHSMSLKSAGQLYLKVELDKTVRGKIHWAGLSEDVIEYSANDVKYLEQIMDKQKTELGKKGLLTAIEYENRFVLPLAYEEYCGVKVDISRWKAKMQKDQARLKNAESMMNSWLLENEPNSKYIKIDRQGNLFDGFNLDPQVTINWNSSSQVIPIFKKYGVDVEVIDKAKGDAKDSIDAKVLKPQKDKCSLIPLYLDYKEAFKVVSTYGENFLKQINQDTGRLYSQFNQLGADTTRITSGGKDKANRLEYINLLNLPSDPETRACFVAEKGNKWISIDYSGQETYLLASIANDEAIIEELTNGSGDIHSLTAYMAYKEIPRDTPIKDIKDKYHHLRQEAKGIEFAINYGGDANTIANNKGIPIEEANKIYNDYMSGFKGVKKYQDFCRKDVMEKGFILLNPLTGHKAYIYDYDELMRIKSRFNQEFWEYYREMKRDAPSCDTVQEVRKFFKRKSASEKQSINYRIQATGSLCLRVSMVNFFEYLRNNDLLFKVLIMVTPYDEINIEAPEEIALDIAGKLYECMVKAGSYFCTRCKLDADISWDIEIKEGKKKAIKGKLPTYWIH